MLQFGTDAGPGAGVVTPEYSMVVVLRAIVAHGSSECQTQDYPHPQEVASPVDSREAIESLDMLFLHHRATLAGNVQAMVDHLHYDPSPS